MANYLYNGVEFPALPTDEFPTKRYYSIGRMSTDADGYYRLYVTTAIPYFVEDGGLNGDLDYYKWGDSTAYSWYSVENGAWSRVTGGATSALSLDEIVWTDTDIKDENGNIVLAASDPIPVYSATDFFNGVALGLSGTGTPAFQENSCFGKGYLAGAEMRLSRPAGEA